MLSLSPAGAAYPRHGVRQRLPAPVLLGILGIAIALMLTCGFGPNSDLAMLSVAVFVAGCILLWRPGESAVLSVTFVFHWLGASVAIFHSNWLETDVFSYSTFGGDMRLAIVLSLLGLLCLAIGMRLGAGAWRPRDVEMARSIALAHPVSRWFYLYCVASGVAILAFVSTWVLPGLAQVLIAAAAMRWAFFFVLAYATFAGGSRGGLYFLLAFAVELAMSLGGYFSDFRTVFFCTIYAVLASGLRLTWRMQAGLAVLAVALLSLGVVWTSVKEEYRYYISEGQRAQVVNVDYATRMTKLVELASNLDRRQIETGVDDLLRRLSYVEFFSVVIGYVPTEIAHEHGALLVDAITRPFLPRTLFPEKSAIDDTERTNLYTGGIAGTSEGTSISIGYIGESYIDFGRYGMMVELFGVGAAYGFAYRFLSRSKGAGCLVGMGVASAVLMTVGLLDSSITKVMGGLAAASLTAWLLVRFVIPFGAPWVATTGEG